MAVLQATGGKRVRLVPASSAASTAAGEAGRCACRTASAATVDVAASHPGPCVRPTLFIKAADDSLTRRKTRPTFFSPCR